MAQEGIGGEGKRGHGALKCSHGCHFLMLLLCLSATFADSEDVWIITDSFSLQLEEVEQNCIQNDDESGYRLGFKMGFVGHQIGLLE